LPIRAAYGVFHVIGKKLLDSIHLLTLKARANSIETAAKWMEVVSLGQGLVRKAQEHATPKAYKK
jgi:hypothetical protein